MSLEIDEEDIDFGTLYADKRHRELLAAIKQLMGALKKDDHTSELSSLIKSSVKEFLDKLKEFSAPSVTVNNDNKTIVSAINEAAKRSEDKLDKAVDLLERLISLRLLPVELTAHRSSYGNLIESVTARVILPKNKYEA